MGKQKKPKVVGTNSMTKYSKELRQKTSNEWIKKNTKSILARFNMKKEEDVKSMDLFKLVPEKTNTLKIKFLLNFYFKNK
ncbi:hypothetical protein [uncultured Gammaproteobacteria bacterium]|uniref:hypothetical protein n=1 Tax=Bathymodiolus heckerae thiotrophic gill symbiont TaxID=1052212 RepID=UPI0010B50F0B|nr:hypothetical protein [Bathymodiolus heckerae thiotrophic gill symbiont]CAC9592220.1 hypothetical protein [uncultured Gammaproteobacteria bacterium]CAC9602962.1 hypothetical protein [uncultured Gammaproteobacteria bacterium]SHN91981.1 hypothetical protein BHECKSOX_12 [Bathymodiolus heckerae thiotrophic gill symbiont]